MLTSPPSLHQTPFERLWELASNLWWSWNPTARQVFQALDQTLWRHTQHNPIKQLQEISPARLAQLTEDILFMRQYTAALKAFDDYMTATDHWFGTHYPQIQAPIAYFSAEFGLHNSIPIYSGGLGILAGDHLKEASDLGVPLVGISFMYAQAYFRQVIRPDGWQEAVYEPVNRHAMPIQPVLTASGDHCRIQVELGSRIVTCAVWMIRVGRSHLYLLDTDVPENDPTDRTLSSRLYGGDLTIRLAQEMLLGIGGVRVLRAVGLQPTVWHANEGHAAFLNVERLREYRQQGLSFDEALQTVRRSSLFTTHTPVPAGHDIFPASLIEQHFAGYWDHMGLTREEFLALGKHPHDPTDRFHMTALAIRLSAMVNGVSQEHARVSRKMWHCLWPDFPLERVPITSVTNGIHIPTWIAPEMIHLYSKYLGPLWLDQSDDAAIWHRVLDIPDHELWEVRQFLKRKLLSFMCQRNRQGWITGKLEAQQVLAKKRDVQVAFAVSHSHTHTHTHN
ncbi:MAG: alpha-glucan family phosphorylase, partial [Nitrospirae bacterium]